MTSSFPKVHLQVCCRDGEIPSLQRKASFSIGRRLTQKRNNHKRGGLTKLAWFCWSTWLFQAGLIPETVLAMSLSQQTSRSSLNKAHLERGKAEPTEVWLHLEPRPGRWSHDIGVIYSKRKFLHEPNMHCTHAYLVFASTAKSAVRHFCAAGQMLGLVLGLQLHPFPLSVDWFIKLSPF